MPNSFAFFILFAWPIIVVVLFKKQKAPAALAWSIIAGYLLLPTRAEIDLPILPSFNKLFIPSFAALVMCMIVAAQNFNNTTKYAHGTRAKRDVNNGITILKGWLPRTSIGFILVLVMFFTPTITALLNDFPLIIGGFYVPRMTYYDALSFGLSAIVTLLPFLMGRKFLSNSDSHVILLRVFCISGFLYTAFALFEVRMSPQLNVWIYGFFPHQFSQHIRNDGFRPVVFLQHGLWLGIFFSMALLASAGLWRSMKGKFRGQIMFMTIWLAMTLYLSKTFGAAVITVLLIPLVFVFKVRMQMIFASVLAVTILLYPMVRGANILPLDSIVSMADKVSSKRAGSLQFRFDNENILLDRANERPFFGWGGWGRARVRDNYSGRDISITDGRWIIVLGNGGWIQYLAEFGLLTIPILLLMLRRKRLEVTIATSSLCLVLCANLVDLIPNASLTPITWLIAGALMGRLEVAGSDTPPDTEKRTALNEGNPYRRDLKPKVRIDDRGKNPIRQKRVRS